MFSWKNIKLARFFTQKTKPSTKKLDQAGVVYDLICFCKAEYVGESKRPL